MRSADIEHLERAKTGEPFRARDFWHGTLGAPHQRRGWHAPTARVDARTFPRDFRCASGAKARDFGCALYGTLGAVSLFIPVVDQVEQSCSRLMPVCGNVDFRHKQLRS
jgi:hypothetical protein